MSKKVYIYGLYDPFTQDLRYIGKTGNLTKRLWEHIKDAKGGQQTYKATWIRKLLREGGKPLMVAIQETTESEWVADEKQIIARALMEGASLTNLTEGGDGIKGYSHSEETREKISRYNKSIGRIPPSQKGRKQSAEHIRKRIEARRKNETLKHSPEAIEKMRISNMGKNMGNTHTKGHKLTKEHKEKISKALTGRKYPNRSKEHSMKIVESRTRNKAKGNSNEWVKSGDDYIKHPFRIVFVKFGKSKAGISQSLYEIHKITEKGTMKFKKGKPVTLYSAKNYVKKSL